MRSERMGGVKGSGLPSTLGGSVGMRQSSGAFHSRFRSRFGRMSPGNALSIASSTSSSTRLTKSSRVSPSPYLTALFPLSSATVVVYDVGDRKDIDE
jgi:hypothetical protein